MLRVVLDTNCLIQSISHRSPYYRIWSDFIAERYALCVTTEILEEYAEILTRHLSPTVAEIVVAAILRANNTVRVDAQFRFNLIAIDQDDNKFVDCAIVSNAAYIVTNDAHFNCLATIPFPRVDVCGIDEFLKELSDEDPIRS